MRSLGVIIVLVLIIAILTNPDKADHEQAVKEIFIEKMGEAAVDQFSTSKNNWEVAGTALGVTLGVALLDKLLENMVFRRNFLVCSLTEVRFDGKSRTIGIGAFGNVWIFEEVKELTNSKQSK